VVGFNYVCASRDLDAQRSTMSSRKQAVRRLSEYECPTGHTPEGIRRVRQNYNRPLWSVLIMIDFLCVL